MSATTTQKKRLTKHELKEDKFVNLAYHAWDEISVHRSAILFIALGIVGLVAVYTLYQRSASAGASRSEEILFLAMNDYQVGRFQEASNGLTQFVDRFPRHPRRGVAALALGNCELALGKPADAEKRFKMAVEASSKGSDLWVSAKSGLGHVAEAQGSFDTAFNEFQEAGAAAGSKEAASEAVAHAIRVKLRSGDAAGARSLLDKAENDYPGTRALRSFSQLRGQLDAAQR